jgi:DNA-binding MarR family transcriptional regulator
MMLLLRDHSTEGHSEILALLHHSGLSPAQVVTLQLLGRRGARPVSEVGSRLQLSASAVSHLIERLVQSGFIRRWEDQKDRRVRRIELTDRGAAMAERLTEALSAELGEGLGVLSLETQERLLSVIEKVIAELALR